MALFRKEEDQPVLWPASSAAVALQRLVAIDCPDISVLVDSLSGHPAAAAAAAAAVQQQPQLDTLVVLVLKYDNNRPLQAVQQLWLRDMSHLRFVDLRFCGLHELHLRNLPSLRVLLINNNRYVTVMTMADASWPRLV
jgi:hypothetical protein